MGTDNDHPASLVDRVARLEREVGEHESWDGPRDDKGGRMEMMMPPISVRATLAQIFTRLGMAPAGYRVASMSVFGALHILAEENALLQSHLEAIGGQLAQAFDRIESLETALETQRSPLESGQPSLGSQPPAKDSPA